MVYYYFRIFKSRQVRLIFFKLLKEFNIEDIASDFQFSLVTQSCLTLRPHGLQHARPHCPSPTAGVYPNSCPLSRWCHPTISSSSVPFSCLQSLPVSGSFPKSWLFTSHGQSNWSFSFSISPSKNIQTWFPLGLSGLISLQSKGLSRVFSNNTVQKHQFFAICYVIQNKQMLTYLFCSIF